MRGGRNRGSPGRSTLLVLQTSLDANRVSVRARARLMTSSNLGPLPDGFVHLLLLECPALYQREGLLETHRNVTNFRCVPDSHRLEV